MKLKNLVATAALALALVATPLGAHATTQTDPPGVPGLVCPEGTVPGWLNEYGDPTSCVGDQACPHCEEPATPAPTEELPPALPLDVIEQPTEDRRDEVLDTGDQLYAELPHTGPEQLGWLVLALALIVLGLLAHRYRR